MIPSNAAALGGVGVVNPPAAVTPVSTSVSNVAAPKAETALPPKLSTYEDCLTAVNNVLASSDAPSLLAVLRSLEGFFKDRIAKKRSDGERDGVSAVRRSILAKREQSATARPV